MVGVWRERRDYVRDRGHGGGAVRVVEDEVSGQGEG